jgi:hypothetical protein
MRILEGAWQLQWQTQATVAFTRLSIVPWLQLE